MSTTWYYKNRFVVNIQVMHFHFFFFYSQKNRYSAFKILSNMVCAGNQHGFAGLTIAVSWAPFWSASILLDCCFAVASSLAFSISSLI